MFLAWTVTSPFLSVVFPSISTPEVSIILRVFPSIVVLPFILVVPFMVAVSPFMVVLPFIVVSPFSLVSPSIVTPEDSIINVLSIAPLPIPGTVKLI